MKLKVLIVEDEPITTKLLKSILRNDFDVLTANDPHEALPFVQENQLFAVISDYMMPISNGVDFLRRCQEITPSSLCILTSAYLPREEGDFIRISKPFDFFGLKDLLLEKGKAKENDIYHRNEK